MSLCGVILPYNYVSAIEMLLERFLEQLSLPDGNYAIRVYADDGDDNMIGICNFTLDT